MGKGAYLKGTRFEREVKKYLQERGLLATDQQLDVPLQDFVGEQ